MPLRIVADKHIPRIAEALDGLGEITLVEGRTITPEQVRDADALMVRAVLKVGPALLDGSQVQFVASATAGNDHLDLEWLASRGIAAHHAPGSNARSVVEWVLSALFAVEEHANAPKGRVLGVVGHGHIGGTVARLAPRFGWRVVACDPPRARGGERDALGNAFVELDELIRSCDALTVHVPLVRSGPDATRGLISAERIAALAPAGAWLLNSSRGDVVDGAALGRALAEGRLGGAAIDVWESEPNIDEGLMRLVAFPTPHIAGYSTEGKLRGTVMVRDAFVRHFGLEAPAWPPPLEPVAMPSPAPTDARAALRHAYDIRAESARFRAIPKGRTLAQWFEEIRKGYTGRREVLSYSGVPEELRAKFV